MDIYEKKLIDAGLPAKEIREIRNSGVNPYDACRGLNEAIAVSPTGRVTTDSIIANAKMIQAQEAKFGRGNYVRNSPNNIGH